MRTESFKARSGIAKNHMRFIVFIALALLILSIPNPILAHEEEYEKTEPEVPLTDWWVRITYPLENLLTENRLCKICVPEGIEDNGVGELQYYEYWPASTSLGCLADNPYVLMFTVTPTFPKLYWRIATADFYDGFGWAKTSESEIVEEFPARAEKIESIFTVNFSTGASRVSLPIPELETNLTNFEVSPHQTALRLYLDETADMYGIGMIGLGGQISVTYRATWHRAVIDESSINIQDIPQEIRNRYLQLPENLPEEVRSLAVQLKDPSLNAVDQILQVIRYLKTNFDYDSDLAFGKTTRTIERDWVLSFLKWKRGVCFDFNTALAIILRCQGIPARVNFGFKPSKNIENKILYFSSGAHSEAEVYLPPYGWVRFDATPPGNCPGSFCGVDDPAMTAFVDKGAAPGIGGEGSGQCSRCGATLQDHECPNCGNVEPVAETQKPLPTPTDIQLQINPEISTREKEIRFSAFLSAKNTPLSRENVEINDSTGNKKICTFITGADGWGHTNYSFSREETVGEHFITARFHGNENYGGASDTKLLLLYFPTTLNLELNADNVRRGSSLGFEGSLEDDFKQGIAGREISILLDGKPVEGIKVRTGSTGKFNASLAIGNDLNLGVHTLQAVFENQEEGYLPSQSHSRTFEVTEKAKEEAKLQENIPENTLVTDPVEENVRTAENTVFSDPTAEIAGIRVEELVIYIALAAIAIISLYGVSKYIKRRRAKAVKPQPPLRLLKRTLTQFGKGKKYRDGIIAAYHQLLGMLMSTGAYSVRPDQTARELSAELSAKIESFARKDFEEFVEVYEKAMFSDKGISKAEFDAASNKLYAAFGSVKLAEETGEEKSEEKGEGEG